MLHDILLCLHLLATIVWVGGMLLMHFVVRPAVATLEPAQRLPLMTQLLQGFFRWVSVAVLVILASGFALLHLLKSGGGALPLHLHLMMATGLLMALIFAWLRLREFPVLQTAVAASNWPAGGAAMLRIRRLVSVNLALGVLTVLIATLGRTLI